ncbi:MAG: hypothetical protein U9P42_09565 [Candidatus Fermentibacteria bacterium]|nr:hypothetical protein [Candidatus Fermentibacteria bacterium]
MSTRNRVIFRLSWKLSGHYAIPETLKRILWYENDLYGATDETGELIRYTLLGENHEEP